MKIHDYHVFMQCILSTTIKGLLPKHVRTELINMTDTFRVLCSKELNMTYLEKIESELPNMMCDIERIFPLAFFNITVHPIVHLVEEAKVAGPIQYRWM